jgi:hypothetical protein
MFQGRDPPKEYRHTWALILSKIVTEMSAESDILEEPGWMWNKTNEVSSTCVQAVGINRANEATMEEDLVPNLAEFCICYGISRF